MPHALKRAFTCALSLLTALTVLASSASATQSAPASTRPTTAPQADHARHYDANSLQPATEPTQQPSATPISEEAPFLTPENLKPQLDLQSEENSRPSSIPATPPQATIDAAEPTSTAAHTSHDSAIVSSTNPSAAPTPEFDQAAPTPQTPQPNREIAQENTPSAHHVSTAVPSNNKPISANQAATHPQNQDLSPWEQFLIYTISLIRMAQNGIEHYFSVLLSKQGIPLLIITFGVLLLNIVIWFAYVSFKKEQSTKIKNLMRNKSTTALNNDRPEPLALAYAEESSGDFDVFATSEGTPIKLDLAQAYINMGDAEGAKEILNDIINQHRGKVVSAAQSMLKKIENQA